MSRVMVFLRATVLPVLLCTTLTACGIYPRTHLPLITMDDRGIAVVLPQIRSGRHVLIDMSSLSGNGRLVLACQQGERWPKDIVLRVTPGMVTSIDVEGRFRMSIPVQGTKDKPVDLPIMPKLYAYPTSEITVAYYR